MAEGASYLAEACSTSELTLIHFCIVLTHRRPDVDTCDEVTETDDEASDTDDAHVLDVPL